MADEGGVGVTDRGALVEALTAVLGRDRAAVRRARQALEQARQHATAAEAFELAARIHAELQALDWISCPQRVTSLDAYAAGVSGWSDGVLVRFGVHAGRIRTWSYRRCELTSATPQVAATPHGWQDFAQRNADLAAALDRSGRELPEA